MKMSAECWEKKISEQIRNGKHLWSDKAPLLKEMICVRLDNDKIVLWTYNRWTGDFTEKEMGE